MFGLCEGPRAVGVWFVFRTCSGPQVVGVI